jgi:hypothetical protein
MRLSTRRWVGLAALVAAIVLVTGADAVGDSDIEISGQIRARTEVDKRQFDLDSTTMSYSDLRTRVTVTAKSSDNVHAVIQLQDSRRLGGVDTYSRLGGGSISSTSQSGSLSNGQNVDVHQAYVQIGELWNGGPGLQAGRFEVNLGDQRVFGAVGWHNVGRSWEGISAFLHRSSLRVAAYWLKRLELNSRLRNDDFDIVGAHVELPNTGLEPFVFFEFNGDQRDDGVPTGISALSRLNLGTHFARGFERWRVSGNGVLQIGEQRSNGGSGYFTQDIAAFLLTFHLTYLPESERKTQVGLGLDYASGDDEPGDDTYNAYNNLYYTGHKYRGYMDYFVESRDEGLMDLILRGQTAPGPGWLIKGDLHYFRAAQDYLVEHTQETSSDIGVEIDLTVSTSRVAGIGLQGGFSVFFPSESFAGPDADPGLWGYVMGTVNFGK